MVRLEECVVFITAFHHCDFNSCMVRLEVGVPGANHLHLIYFNSCMVRLEGNIVTVYYLISQISIPVWYDWKKAGTAPSGYDYKFQFLYGTIGRRSVLVSIWASVLFQFLYGTIGRLSIKMML